MSGCSAEAAICSLQCAEEPVRVWWHCRPWPAWSLQATRKGGGPAVGQSKDLQLVGKARHAGSVVRAEAGNMVAMQGSICPAACCSHMCLSEPGGHLLRQAPSLQMGCGSWASGPLGCLGFPKGYSRWQLGQLAQHHDKQDALWLHLTPLSTYGGMMTHVTAA